MNILWLMAILQRQVLFSRGLSPCRNQRFQTYGESSPSLGTINSEFAFISFKQTRCEYDIPLASSWINPNYLVIFSIHRSHTITVFKFLGYNILLPLYKEWHSLNKVHNFVDLGFLLQIVFIHIFWVRSIIAYRFLLSLSFIQRMDLFGLCTCLFCHAIKFPKASLKRLELYFWNKKVSFPSMFTSYMSHELKLFICFKLDYVSRGWAYYIRT